MRKAVSKFARHRGFLGDSVTTSIKFPREVHEDLAAEALERQISLGTLIREAMAERAAVRAAAKAARMVKS